MDFEQFKSADGVIENNYAAKTLQGEWIQGTIDPSFLNKHFGQYSNAGDMKNATSSEGLQLFFDDLVAQGKLQA